METPLKQTRDTDINPDLLLAAEIGKTLLERNRELESLLKSSQDFCEEQAIQVDYYMKQVDILRESNETITHTCEQFESANTQLHDKYELLQGEKKILQGENVRLWELISSLEKRNEELSVRLNNIETDSNDKENKGVIKIDYQESNFKNARQEQRKKKQEDKRTCSCSTIIPNIEHEMHNLQNHISELKVSLNVAKWQKEELTAQLDDVIEENQVLHRKIANLKVEINDWEKFAENEENYRRLAEAFSVKHHIEIEVDTLLEQQTQLSPNTKAKISKAKSCEFLAQPICNLKTRNLVNNVLSSVNSSSFLSELDSEYAELVKRYEALLEKCKQDSRFLENPERTRKVQRAIQTLSFDFGKRASAESSPVTCTADEGILTSPASSPSKSDLQSKVKGDVVPDYRKIFAEIFAIIKQSKDDSPVNEMKN